MTTIACNCGSVALDLEGPPILAAECHCASCREAAERLKVSVTEKNGGTRYVLQRKDRTTVMKGEAHLAAFRLNDDTSTRRIVATCCNAPMWLEFKGGHWISVYSARWPNGEAPTGHSQRLDRTKYEAMRDALLLVLPTQVLGLKVAEAKEALLPILPECRSRVPDVKTN